MGEAVKKFQEYFGLPVTGEAGGRGDDERYEETALWSWGAYHLHGKPGNSGWKLKWYIPFHLKHLRNYRLLA